VPGRQRRDVEICNHVGLDTAALVERALEDQVLRTRRGREHLDREQQGFLDGRLTDVALVNDQHVRLQAPAARRLEVQRREEHLELRRTHRRQRLEQTAGRPLMSRPGRRGHEEHAVGQLVLQPVVRQGPQVVDRPVAVTWQHQHLRHGPLLFRPSPVERSPAHGERANDRAYWLRDRLWTTTAVDNDCCGQRLLVFSSRPGLDSFKKTG
jgi:hypothetical protein